MLNSKCFARWKELDSNLSFRDQTILQFEKNWIKTFILTQFYWVFRIIIQNRAKISFEMLALVID